MTAEPCCVACLMLGRQNPEVLAISTCPNGHPVEVHLCEDHARTARTHVVWCTACEGDRQS